MIFSDAVLISTNPLDSDKIVVSMRESLFVDIESGLFIESNDEMIREIPRQMKPDFAEKFDKNVVRANQVVTSLIGLNLILKLLLQRSLKYIWGIVNTL